MWGCQRKENPIFGLRSVYKRAFFLKKMLILKKSIEKFDGIVKNLILRYINLRKKIS